MQASPPPAERVKFSSLNIHAKDMDLSNGLLLTKFVNRDSADFNAFDGARFLRDPPKQGMLHGALCNVKLCDAVSIRHSEGNRLYRLAAVKIASQLLKDIWIWLEGIDFG